MWRIQQAGHRWRAGRWSTWDDTSLDILEKSSQEPEDTQCASSQAPSFSTPSRTASEAGHASHPDAFLGARSPQRHRGPLPLAQFCWIQAMLPREAWAGACLHVHDVRASR